MRSCICHVEVASSAHFHFRDPRCNGSDEQEMPNRRASYSQGAKFATLVHSVIRTSPKKRIPSEAEREIPRDSKNLGL